MVSITTSIFKQHAAEPEGLVTIHVVTASTARAGDTFTVDVATLGITELVGATICMNNNSASFFVWGGTASANGSQIITLDFRVAKAGTVYTVTLPANPAGWLDVPNTYYIQLIGLSRASHTGDLPAF